MRILLITHFFPPRHNAGTENYALGLAKSLQSKGHDVRVVCAEDWDTGASYYNGITEEIYQGVPVKRIHLNWMMAGDPNRVLYYSHEMKTWLSRLLEKEPFDIVHILSAYSFGVGIMESVKAARIPLVLTLMDFWFLCPSVQLLRSGNELCDGVTTAMECQSCLMVDSGVSRKIVGLGISPEVQALFWGPLSRLTIVAKQRGFLGNLLNMSDRKSILKEAIELPDLVLTHSRIVREMFSRHTGRNIKIVQNGHELSWLNTYKGKTSSQKLRIGYVGQIIPIKGVHVLIKAFKWADLGSKAKLEIWGELEKDPEYTDRLRALIENDSSIALHGHFLHDHLAGVFSNIDVLVVPSLWYENAPLVIQEAFAAGTPVIITNLGGMAEMVSHDVNGLLFERGNAEDLAGQLRRLIEEPGLLERLMTGITKVKTTEEEVGELETLYRELVQKRKS